MSDNRQQTYDKIVAIISEKIKKKPDIIRDAKTIQELGADSLDMVEIIMNIKEEFVVEINDEDAEKLDS